MRGGLIATALLLAGAARAAAPGDGVGAAFAGIPHVRFAYRPIAGTTLDELAAGLEASAAHPAGGGSSFGETRWSIRWHWRGAGAGRACRVRSVEMMFDALVTLPRLADGTAPDEAVRGRWDAFAAAIAAHEAGHARRAWAGVPAVRRAILAASCDGADAAGRAALRPVQAGQLDYDRQTRNGAAQGARFP